MGRLYPVVGMKERGVRIEANFGRSAFVYDLDRHRVLRNKIEHERRGRWIAFRLGESAYDIGEDSD
jgi:hypothetical protein